MPKQPKLEPGRPPKNWEDEYRARNAQIGATLVLADLSDHERAFLATCQKIHRRDTGCTTPFEEFFTKLVITVESGHWPTPDDVEHELKEFRENFDAMQSDVRAFIEAYPEKETTNA
ncbi:MAG: hypothetical protein JWO19_2665 [Bryobacterales bacterium]|nr:hypothetical protein [Bryobacterales bacterium]